MILLKQRKYNIKFKTNGNKKVNYKWIFGITVATFFVAILFGYIALIFMEIMDLVMATVILLLIVFIGIFFDMLGIAVTAADETPFHSMAAGKVLAAKESIYLIRNAGIVANFFNDVVGDISGIISGAATGAIVTKIMQVVTVERTIISILLSAVVAALTVGGKAVGKEIALRKTNYIVYKLGVMMMLSSKLKNIFKKQS